MKPPSDPGAGAPSADGLEQRRLAIHRGLQRSFYAVGGVSALVGLLAVAAVWLSRQSQERASRLWTISSTAAAIQRKARQEGQRTEAIRIIAEAASFRPSRQLRDEALSALLLPDVGTNLVWHPEDGFEFPAAYDAKLRHFIQNNDRGRAIVRSAPNGAVLMDEPGFGRGTAFWEFSPDDQLAAIAFYEGHLGVWEWRKRQLLARIPILKETPCGNPIFDFAPDGKHLWLISQDGSLRQFAQATGKPGDVVVPNRSAQLFRLSPSGKLAALGCGKDLEVWDLTSHTQTATLALTNDISRLAWQPGEERLAIGCYGSLWLWDIGAPAAVSLRADGDPITGVFFNGDGDLLFVQGWTHPAQIWNVRNRGVVLAFGSAGPASLSSDETRLAVATDRVGYGIREYLAPTGLRHWLSPPSLGGPAHGGDLDSRERWVLTGHPNGWLLRDADSGKELVRTVCELTGLVTFSSDDSNVLAWTKEGLVRWPLELRSDTTVEAQPKHVLIPVVPQEWPAGFFSADRRFAAWLLDGVVTVAKIDDLGQRVAIPLRRDGDTSLYLSPDGLWLITGRHNQHGLDWYDTREGKFVRTFASQGFATPVFDPYTGALFTCTASDYTKWHLATGKPERKVTWRAPYASQNFLGFASDGRQAVTSFNGTGFHLHDLRTGRDFATLNFRDSLAVYKCRWSRDGQRLFLFGNDAGVTRLHLQPLRRELDKLRLNWSDNEPSREFEHEEIDDGASIPHLASRRGTAQNVTPALAVGRARQPAAMRQRSLADPTQLSALVSVALLLILLIGVYILRYQRRLFNSYLETEALAARRETELREAHAALLHNEKMKALGTLAAGVAHDFNNLLSVVRLSSELIEEQAPPSARTRENFDAIRQAVQRGRGIVNSMLGYARDDGQPRRFGAEELVSEAVALLGKSFLGGLILRVEVQAGTPILTAHKGRLEQMLFNLILNAAEAMGGKGTLDLTARPLAEPGPCLLPPSSAPAFVELAVQDSGPGIRPDLLARIFEPFFTTKTTGARRGTGLGLSMLYAMAREDGIGVAVISEPGMGSTFRLVVPVPNPDGPECTERELPVAPSPQTHNPQT